MTSISIFRVKFKRRSRESVAVALTCPGFFCAVGISLCVNGMNERTSLFDSTALLFELYLPKHHVFLASSSSVNQKTGRSFLNPVFPKKDGPSQWKVPLFVRHGFSRERDKKPYIEFYMKKVLFLIYRMVPRIFGFWWKMYRTYFRVTVLESVAVLGLSLKFTEAHNISTLQF
jgi:hypothetical protein